VVASDIYYVMLRILMIEPDVFATECLDAAAHLMVSAHSDVSFGRGPKFPFQCLLFGPRRHHHSVWLTKIGSL